MKKAPAALLFVFLILGPGSAMGCRAGKIGLRDGYYTAEASDFDRLGWKEFVTLRVSNGRIIMVEYNAKNPSGFMKSWDMDYTWLMNKAGGTYPDDYTRAYAAALLNNQGTDGIDALAGATVSHRIFIQLARKAIEQARTGDVSVAFVNLSE